MHESSDGHREAMLSFASRQREAGRVDYLAAKQIEEERCYWRQIVKRLIDVLIFLSERGLAIRGMDEIIGLIMETFLASLSCWRSMILCWLAILESM